METLLLVERILRNSRIYTEEVKTLLLVAKGKHSSVFECYLVSELFLLIVLEVVYDEEVKKSH